MSTTCIQGRNDGFLYDAIPPGFGTTQPIGYNISVTTGATAIPSSNTTITNRTLPTMSAGVWIVSCNFQVTKGNSVWDGNSYISSGYTFAASPGAGDMSGCRGSATWNAGFTGPTISCQFPTLHFIAYEGSQVQPNCYFLYGTGGPGTGKYTFSFRAAKVA